LDEARHASRTRAGVLPSQGETWIEHRLSMIERYIKPARGDRLLEVGCAAGELLHHFGRHGCRVAGCDSHPDAENRQLGIIPVALETFPEPAEPFDYVFAFHVLEEVDDPRAFLNRCLALLRSRGEMLLLVSLLPSFSDRHAQYFSDISIGRVLRLQHARSVKVDYEIFRDTQSRIYRNAIVHVSKQ
jgi:cyclopropane fatty-acyl-phospholipid synthase-like methyltransferase